MLVQLRSISTRLVSGDKLALAIPFSLSSMIQIIWVPSALRGKVVVVFEPMEVLVPLPNFGFSPMNKGRVWGQSEWTSIDVGTGVLLFGSSEGSPPAGIAGSFIGAEPGDALEGDVPPWGGGIIKQAERDKAEKTRRRLRMTPGLAPLRRLRQGALVLINRRPDRRR